MPTILLEEHQKETEREFDKLWSDSEIEEGFYIPTSDYKMFLAFIQQRETLLAQKLQADKQKWMEKLRIEIMAYYNSCVPTDKQPLQWQSRILDIINNFRF